MNNKKERFDKIINRLCQYIEIEEKKEQDVAFKKQRLLEQIELQSYPYSEMICPHRESMNIDEDCVACQDLQYENYRDRFHNLKNEKGLKNPHTLKAAFDFYHSLITRYYLTECDALLNEIYPACCELGKNSLFYFQCIQALSFLRFKQGNYDETIDFFKKQIEVEGPNDIIYENMALACSRLNQKEKACEYYAKAILMSQKTANNQERMATLLLGLSTAIDQPEDALIVLEESLVLLKKKYEKPHSLIAKTLSAMGDYHMLLKAYDQAQAAYREATEIFLVTCGEDTPLTANATQKLSESLMALKKTDKGIEEALKALKLWIEVDPVSFDANQVVKLLLLFSKEMKHYKQNNDLRNKIRSSLLNLTNKITTTPFLSTDLNILCLLKFIYEWHCLNEDIENTIGTCRTLLEKLNALEKMDETQRHYHAMLLKEVQTIVGLASSLKK